MRRRGPPPRPTVLKVLAGNPGRRPLNPLEPKPKAGSPTRPEFLTGTALDAWDRTEKALSSMRVLTTADGDALAVYAEAFKKWREAEDFLSEKGLVYPIRDDKGNVKCFQAWPQVSIARQMMLVLCRYQGEFGLTPSSRSRVNAADSPQRSKTADSDADFA